MAMTAGSVSGFAQSQFEGTVDGKNAESLLSSIEGLQKQSIDALVFDRRGGAGAFASGRLRSSSHDGFSTSPNFGPPGSTYAFDTTESSAFVTGFYKIPGTVLGGGSLAFAGLIGANNLDMEMRPNRANPFPAKGQIGSAENESLLYGGNVVWSYNLTYVSAMVVGHSGNTDLTDKFLGPGNFVRFSYDTSGVIGNLVVGQVVPLGAGPNALKLDLRGSLGYVKNEGDAYDQKVPLPGIKLFTSSDFEATSVAFSPMLFMDFNAGGGVMRPYIQATVRKFIDYENTTTLTDGTGAILDKFFFNESHLYYNVELGYSFNSGNWSVGAAYYVDFSDDVMTNGGRVTASLKLN